MNTLTFSCAQDIENHVCTMRNYFEAGNTLPVSFRIEQIKKLRTYLKNHEEEALTALNKDLGKAEFEGYATEIGIVYDEIATCLKNIKKWAKPKRVGTSIVHFYSTSKVYPSPLGVAGILSPWNYPIQLALVPLVDAITAGNCVVLKPSRTSVHTSAFLKRMCDEIFDPQFICCLEGSPAMNEWILEVTFDKIFFTGSPQVGRDIMKAAAKNLTNVTLELGGKSPCIIDKTANIKRAAQRIAWGKCINSGQTCVAPDYFLVHEEVVDEFIAQMDTYLHQYYGNDIMECSYYPHMINEHHFDRVCGLIDNHNKEAKIVLGGKRNKESLTIEPTIMTGVTLEDPVMNEEIFGPVMPIITWKTLDQALAVTKNFGYPLACYLFSEDTSMQEHVISHLSFGGATINDCIIHLANNKMGFGGVGESGLGAYHGKAGFDAFTHYKSTLKKSTLIEVPVRVPPFGNKIKLLRILMK